MHDEKENPLTLGTDVYVGIRVGIGHGIVIINGDGNF